MYRVVYTHQGRVGEYREYIPTMVPGLHTPTMVPGLHTPTMGGLLGTHPPWEAC